MLADQIRLTASLVRRDYAVQYAGTALGLVWLVIQYVFQIGIFYLIFGVILAAHATPRKLIMPAGPNDYLAYLLGGMALWMPLSDMLLRSCGILTENRQLIRRTSIGAGHFVWVPVLEAMLHYAILFTPICALGYFRGVLSPAFPLAFLLGQGTLLFFAGWGVILARVSVLVKDVSPLMRLVLQIVFWCTPIVYPATPNTLPYFAWNPIFVIAEYHRNLLFTLSGNMLGEPSLLQGLGLLLVLSVPAYFLSARRLSTTTSDHI